MSTSAQNWPSAEDKLRSLHFGEVVTPLQTRGRVLQVAEWERDLPGAMMNLSCQL